MIFTNFRRRKQPIPFEGDRFKTAHKWDFAQDPQFAAAFDHALQYQPAKIRKSQYGCIWRAHICCWAAQQALSRVGDFVECGVRYGLFSRTIARYTTVTQDPSRRFFLIDKEFPATDWWPGAVPIEGAVPGILSQVNPSKVVYLSIDMNEAEPELAALEYFYPKMVPGGVIVLDDYGWQAHAKQKAAHDAFFQSKPETILCLPTGQGIVIKQ